MTHFLNVIKKDKHNSTAVIKSPGYNCNLLSIHSVDINNKKQCHIKLSLACSQTCFQTIYRLETPKVFSKLSDKLENYHTETAEAKGDDLITTRYCTVGLGSLLKDSFTY